MNSTKTKYLGILYVFILTLVQGTLMVLVLSWLLEFNIFEEDVFSFLTHSYDLGIPIVFVVSLIRGRKIGTYISTGKGKQNILFTLLSTIALSMALLYVFLYWYYDLIEPSERINYLMFFESFIFFIVVWIVSFIVFFPSSIFFARVLEWLMKR